MQGYPIKTKDLLDDRIRSKISVVEVECSPDLKSARVQVSIFGETVEKREAFIWLVNNAKVGRWVVEKVEDTEAVKMSYCMRGLGGWVVEEEAGRMNYCTQTIHPPTHPASHPSIHSVQQLIRTASFSSTHPPTHPPQKKKPTNNNNRRFALPSPKR